MGTREGGETRLFLRRSRAVSAGTNFNKSNAISSLRREPFGVVTACSMYFLRGDATRSRRRDACGRLMPGFGTGVRVCCYLQRPDGRKGDFGGGDRDPTDSTQAGRS